MMKTRLDFLKRRLKGKNFKKEYDSLFFDFNDKKLISLERSVKIIEELKLRATEDYIDVEFVQENLSFIESDLLRNVYRNLNDSNVSYLFTDKVELCGLYLVNSKDAFEKAFRIAFKDETCFILDKDFKYYFRINYYSKDHNDYPNLFDIKRKF